MKRAPGHVRYLVRFGEHKLTRSFTARDHTGLRALFGLGARKLHCFGPLLDLFGNDVVE